MVTEEMALLTAFRDHEVWAEEVSEDVMERLAMLEERVKAMETWRGVHVEVCSTLVAWVRSLELDQLMASMVMSRQDRGQKFLRRLARCDPEVLP